MARPAGEFDAQRYFRGDHKLRFYNIAQASLEEARYYLILSRDLGYGVSDQVMQMANEVCRMLEAYMQGLKDS